MKVNTLQNWGGGVSHRHIHWLRFSLSSIIDIWYVRALIMINTCENSEEPTGRSWFLTDFLAMCQRMMETLEILKSNTTGSVLSYVVYSTTLSLV